MSHHTLHTNLNAEGPILCALQQKCSTGRDTSSLRQYKVHADIH